MKFKEYLEKLNNLALDNPSCLEFDVIYSHDDEGNEYQKVNCDPGLTEIDNIEDNRDLQITWTDDDEEESNYNAVIIN